MRSKAYRRLCIDCNRPRDEVGRDRGDGVLILSYKGLCVECGHRNMIAQSERSSLNSHEWLDSYRRGTAAAVGASLPPKPDADSGR